MCVRRLLYVRTHARSRGKDLSAVGVTAIAGPHRLLNIFFRFFFSYFPGVIYQRRRPRNRRLGKGEKERKKNKQENTHLSIKVEKTDSRQEGKKIRKKRKRRPKMREKFTQGLGPPSTPRFLKAYCCVNFPFFSLRPFETRNKFVFREPKSLVYSDESKNQRARSTRVHTHTQSANGERVKTVGNEEGREKQMIHYTAWL